MTTYRIYGNSDDPPEGFKDDKEFKAYISKDIFNDVHRRRYRYSETYFAEKLLLSFDGYAYGHFNISHAEEPTPEDIAAYSKTKKVFIVESSTLYGKRVDLHQKDSPETGSDSFRFHVRQRGLEISESEFNRIIEAAETTETFPKQDIDRRYCRIGYNLNGWRKPSGASDESTSYLGSHKFGHEEWNFNFEWLIDGKKYGFFEPVHRFHDRYKGTWLSLKLYTKFGDHNYYVGRIKKVYVPHDDELAAAVSQIVLNGWFDQMKADIANIGADEKMLDPSDPALVINVRYDPADVELETEMPKFDPTSKPARTKHYVLINDDDAPLPSIELEDSEEDGWLPPKKRFELQFERAVQQCQIVDPKHARIQNRLYDWLCKKHGAKAVGFEKQFVDLRLTLSHEVTFFEIKTAATAKRCIREALGQLFEYSEYSSEAKADPWVVVADCPTTPDDLAYLKHLRSKFDLPIFYAQFDEATGSLGEYV